MPYASLDSLRLFYKEHRPSGSHSSSSTETYKANTPLVFLHGFTLDHRMWAAQAAFFRDRYRVILPDSRGHGLSDAPETGYSRAHRVEDLQRFVDNLHIERFHLVGLSMGGSTAIGYALKYQEKLTSLTLVSTGIAGYDVGGKISYIDRIAHEKGVEAARKKWKEITLVWYKQEKKEIRELMGRMMDEYSGAVWRDSRRGRYPRENDLEQVHTISVPTMIFAGGADRIFLPPVKLLHEKIPNSRLSIFEGVGHMVNLEAPERFNRELEQFLEGGTKSFS